MSDEEMSRRYRRASEATAGGPGDATRAAIRREAEAQAAARSVAGTARPAAAPLIAVPPAANDSRWAMRAVASVAAVAVAAGLWWQLRPQVEELTTASPMVAATEVAPQSAPPGDAPVQAVKSPPPPQTANRTQQRSARSNEMIAASPQRARDSVAAAAPNSVAAAAAPEPAEAAAATESAVAAAAPTDALRAEIARRFPDAWHSSTPVAGLWVRLNTQGSIVAAGRRADAANTSSLADTRLQRAERVAPSAAAASGALASKAEQAATVPAGRSVDVVNERGVTLRIQILP